MIVQAFESLTTSAIDADIRSPGWTVMLVIWSSGAGTSSYHASYVA